MTTQRPSSQLDDAYDALRAWCHQRPDLQDPSVTYNALATITSITSTLRHIAELTSRSTRRATGTDDHRDIGAACEQIDQLTRAASRALDDARGAIGAVHQITSHLIFAVVDDEDVADPAWELAGDEGGDLPPST